ncbi:MAG TPA: hypothetical protein VK204_14090 [Nocardioidaceae bacterium]|nr:hypothetical protein [Nocardioidaceae bacterium]
MHPILMAELANDRHAELVRNAEARRRAVRAGRSRTLLARTGDSLSSAAGRLRRPAVVASWSAPADACCA